MIQEARALKTLSIEGAHGREDPFRDYFTGLSDLEVSRKDSSKASSFFNEAHQALNRASALQREAFSRSRVELSRCEADLRGLIEERNSLKLLCGQKEEETKDLRADLAKALQLQQKVERIEQLHEEVNMIKAETLGWKEGMDCFAAEKEIALSKLSSTESQIRGMREKSSAEARKVEDLKARLASELAKAKSEVEKAKAKADAILAVYRAGAEAAQVQEREEAETAQTRAY
ncbi:interactor of constitutive active ROPs 4-like [Nicotiana tomentosiformis]|uniref:interactor of constitutive active ROPs 4-like n=1 Tax=Nicotiana tomentosiformis TaxID=4098 RepID=UPI00388CCBA5